MQRAPSDPRVARRRFARIALRIAAASLVALAIGAPSPGHLGSCGLSGGAVAADPVQFCTDKETFICIRECGTGRWDAAMCSTMCGDNPPTTAMGVAAARCAGAGFPPGCALTQAQANACITSLQDLARLSTPFLEIPECNVAMVCAASGGLTSSEPEGI